MQEAFKEQNCCMRVKRHPLRGSLRGKKAQLTAVYLTIIRMKTQLNPFRPERKQFVWYLSPVVAFLPARRFIRS